MHEGYTPTDAIEIAKNIGIALGVAGSVGAVLMIRGFARNRRADEKERGIHDPYHDQWQQHLKDNRK